MLLDENIWEFASAHQFAAIVTRDTDFFEIQKRRGESAILEGGHTPLLVFVPENISADALVALFAEHTRDIRGYVDGRDHLACSLGKESGCQPLFL
ncbi:MAG TPA: hypothetical protein DCM27_04075 [Rhodospirillaceae bacterium]|nr:hypothetical protein [Rhodospirillaceae bacterium]